MAARQNPGRVRRSLERDVAWAGGDVRRPRRSDQPIPASQPSAIEKCREATKVRREFVKTLLSRKTAPKGWQYFTVHAITHHPETASGYDGKVATEMIGAKTGEDTDRWSWNPLRDHVARTTARPEFALIALICAGEEKTIQKDSWRSAGQVHNAYLTQLVAWGYVDRT